MNDLLECCNPCVCTQKIEMDEHLVWITGILCLAFFLSLISCLYFLYNQSNKRNELEKEKRQAEENLSKKTEELQKAQDELNKVDKNQIKEDEKTKEFLDYCYTMAKSLEKGNEKQREDCWKILLYIHADCIPDELKQKYNVGNNVVDNVANPE